MSIVTTQGNIILTNTTISHGSLVTDGLILYFDFGSPQTYPGSGHTIYDLSLNAYSGSLMLNPIYQSENLGSFYLDGISYMSMHNQSIFNHTQFTYCGWLKLTSNSYYWNRVLSKKLTYDDTTGYEITLDGNSPSTYIYISGAGSKFAVINTINWVNAGWHYLTVIYDNNVASAYIDGIYKGQGSINTIQSNSRALNFGRLDGESGLTQWIGNMAHICIYNRVLTQTEITQNYNSFKSRYQ